MFCGDIGQLTHTWIGALQCVARHVVHALHILARPEQLVHDKSQACVSLASLHPWHPLASARHTPRPPKSPNLSVLMTLQSLVYCIKSSMDAALCIRNCHNCATSGPDFATDCVASAIAISSPRPSPPVSLSAQQMELGSCGRFPTAVWGILAWALKKDISRGGFQDLWLGLIVFIARIFYIGWGIQRHIGFTI